MRALNVILALLVSCGLAFGVVEGGLRLMGMGPPETINHFDSDLGWSMVPGAIGHRSTREFDVTYRVNELGLRDDPMSSPKKPDNIFRVLCLGDSFVMGYTVERDDLFVDLLERWWRAENRRVDVINGGTEGWSTDQEARWFDRRGAEFEPDLVLLFTYENDLYWNGRASYRHYPKPRYQPTGELEPTTLEDPGGRSLGESLATGRFLSAITGGKRGDLWVPDGSDRNLPMEWGAYFTPAPAFMTEAVDRTRGALSALQTRCAEVGADLLLVPIPNKAVIHEKAREKLARSIGSETGWSAARPVETFLGLARELSIDSLDPRPGLARAAEDGERLYYEDDWHFNPAGNRALAGILHDELASKGVFPEAHSATVEAEMPVAARTWHFPTWGKVFLVLWVFLSTLYATTYRDEPLWKVPVQVGLLLGAVFLLAVGGGGQIAGMPGIWRVLVFGIFVIGLLTFIAYKLGGRIGTILELFGSFVRRGHWYLLPLVVVLLTVGSLLVVAASSPLVAPFIYTLF